MPSIVALIPARAGSKRCPRKNTRLLGGKPLIQWTIEAAKASGIFSRICVCSDDPVVNDIAARMVDTLIPRNPVADDEPDIRWVSRALERLAIHHTYDAFAILRPTSPFRTADTITRAWAEFTRRHQARPAHEYLYLRAVEPVRQHPLKMWHLVEPKAGDPFLAPLMRDKVQGVPGHSSPTQTLPQVFVQNASLEIAETRLVTERGVICSDYPIPFFTEGHEGIDINTDEDFTRAEQIAASLTHV